MNNSWVLFLILTLVFIVLQGFFSMFEMACVSFNKVRLQYYVTQKNRRARWLNFLLDKPSRLFGTTLIGVNAMLQLGSECSRRFYEALNINPDLAPITQIFLVLIFGELAPMFAARRHSEHVSMLSIPIIYIISRILTPVIWAIDGMSHVVHRLLGKSKEYSLYLSREEVQKAFEEKDSKGMGDNSDINALISNIFTVKSKVAKEMMIPIEMAVLIPSQCTLQEMRHILSVNYTPFIPIYHRNKQNIVAIAYPRDLLRVNEEERVIEHAKPPWFISEDSPILQILKQFQRNNQSTAVILDSTGQASGILTLGQIVDVVFGETEQLEKLEEKAPKPFVERTFSGEMTLAEFNVQFQAHLKYEGAQTLSELVTKVLKHHPAKGESIEIDRYLITVIEPSLLGARVVSVKTLH